MSNTTTKPAWLYPAETPNKPTLGSWLRVEHITLVATTQSGSRYTVIKRPGLPSVVVAPDQRCFSGTLLETGEGRMLLVKEPFRTGSTVLLRTTPVVSVYVLEN